MILNTPNGSWYFFPLTIIYNIYHTKHKWTPFKNTIYTTNSTSQKHTHIYIYILYIYKQYILKHTHIYIYIYYIYILNSQNHFLKFGLDLVNFSQAALRSRLPAMGRCGIAALWRSGYPDSGRHHRSWDRQGVACSKNRYEHLWNQSLEQVSFGVLFLLFSKVIFNNVDHCTPLEIPHIYEHIFECH